jgi:glycosyltransferase involved in cell wall biosynthesis
VTLELGISVIICCYNSASRIQTTLRYLALQEISGKFECEIIVVNNASTDDLEEVVNRVWNESGKPYPLKIVFEKTPGVALARKCGVQEAKYSYGVFCDDDNWLAPNYLSQVFNTFESNNKIGVVGGASTPVFDNTAPPWFYTNCGRYAVGIQGEKTGDITHRVYVWGAGMGFRTWLLKKIFESGLNPLVIGRKKDILTSGDDGEISVWFIFAGYRLWYDQALIFQHYIPNSRLTSSYYEKRLSDTQTDKMWPTYRDYVILKYGVFNDPRKRTLMGTFSILKRMKTMIRLFDYASSISSVRKFEKLIRQFAPQN